MTVKYTVWGENASGDRIDLYLTKEQDVVPRKGEEIAYISDGEEVVEDIIATEVDWWIGEEDAHVHVLCEDLERNPQTS